MDPKPNDSRTVALCRVAPFITVFAGTVLNLCFALLVHRSLFRLVSRELVLLFIIFPILLFACGCVAFSRHRRTGIALITMSVLVIGLRTYMIHIEPNWIRVRRETFHSDKLTKPLRIVHFTDLQSDQIDANEERAVRMIVAEKPDIVIHTGDLLQPIPPYTLDTEFPKVNALFRQIQPPVGFFTSSGDTDYPETLVGVGGMTLLDSASATVEHDGDRIRILGLSLGETRDYKEHFTRAKIEAFRAESRPRDFEIVMGHAPDYALVAQDIPLDLCLAGHTHGGQVNIPGFGAIVTLSSVPRKWARGLNQLQATRLNVSTGVGAEHAAQLPSLRLFCRPEIVVIDVLPMGSATR